MPEGKQNPLWLHSCTRSLHCACPSEVRPKVLPAPCFPAAPHSPSLAFQHHFISAGISVTDALAYICHGQSESCQGSTECASAGTPQSHLLLGLPGQPAHRHQELHLRTVRELTSEPSLKREFLWCPRVICLYKVTGSKLGGKKSLELSSALRVHQAATANQKTWNYVQIRKVLKWELGCAGSSQDTAMEKHKVTARDTKQRFPEINEICPFWALSTEQITPPRSVTFPGSILMQKKIKSTNSGCKMKKDSGNNLCWRY